MKWRSDKQNFKTIKSSVGNEGRQSKIFPWKISFVELSSRHTSGKGDTDTNIDENGEREREGRLKEPNVRSILESTGRPD